MYIIPHVNVFVNTLPLKRYFFVKKRVFIYKIHKCVFLCITIQKIEFFMEEYFHPP